MKQAANIRLNIEKPQKPHRVVAPSEIPTKEEIMKRYERIEKLKQLGINTATLDANEEDVDEFEEDIDKLKASIFIMQDKEVPVELQNRILEKNKTKNKK